MKYPFLLTNVISQEFNSYIRNYIEYNKEKFYNNGMGDNRKFLYFKDTIVNKEKQIIVKKFEIDNDENYQPCMAYYDCIGIDIENGFVHSHIDFTEPGYIHTRINIMISKPQGGGNPILDNNKIIVNENDAWICLASIQKHETDPVIGVIPRIILSLGMLIRENLMIDKLNKYQHWKNN